MKFLDRIEQLIQASVGLAALIFGLFVLLNFSSCRNGKFQFEIAIISTETKK